MMDMELPRHDGFYPQTLHCSTQVIASDDQSGAASDEAQDLGADGVEFMVISS